MAENAENKVLEPTNEENTDFKPITSQEQLNKIIQERLSREKKKSEEVTNQISTISKQLEELTEKYQKAEKSSSELAEKYKTLQAENEKYAKNALKQKVATENNLPANAVEFLQGDTDEELSQSAAKLRSLLSPQQPIAQNNTHEPENNGLQELLSALTK
jgi:SMC interacting uncharacterized protein involved in chromosome segregation